MSNKYDSDVILIFIPVVGFVCGVIVVIFNFLASEAIKYSEYRLTKVEGVAWCNQTAVRRVRFMTVCGLLGVGLMLVQLVDFAFSTNRYIPDPIEVIVLPIGGVIGYGFGVISYFFLWILFYLTPKSKPSRDKAIKAAGKFNTSLNQLYQKWKNHDYMVIAYFAKLFILSFFLRFPSLLKQPKTKAKSVFQMSEGLPQLQQQPIPPPSHLSAEIITRFLHRTLHRIGKNALKPSQHGHLQTREWL